MRAFQAFSRLSIRWKLVLGVAMVHLLLMTVFVVDLVYRQRAFLLDEAAAAAQRQAALTADVASSWVLADDLEGMREVLQSIRQSSPLRYALIADTRGRVLAHTETARIGRYLADPVSLKALEDVGGPRVFQTDRHTIHAAAPILMNNQTLGWVLLGLDTTPIDAHITWVSLSGFLYTLVAIAAGTVFAFFLARYILRQLRLLLAGVHRMEVNELDRPIPIVSRDEIGRVGQALNTAMESLSRSRAEIEEEVIKRRRAEQDIRYLSRELIGSSEEERKRIGHDLHDELGQMITGLQFGLQSLSEVLPRSPEQAMDLSGRLVMLTEEMGEAVSRIASRLWPAALEHLGLVAAARSHVREFNCRLPELRIRFEAPDFPGRLDPRLELACFRIVQEAMTNIARHAHAREVDVLLEAGNGLLRLVVKDDGVGFDQEVMRGRPDRDRHGIGLMGMHERAASVGGRVRVVTEPGKGCAVMADIPLSLPEGPEREQD